MKHTLGVLSIICLLILIYPAQAQDNPPPITPDNAGQVTLIARLGLGIIASLAWSPDGQILAVDSSAGIWLYNTADYTIPPRLLEGQGGERRTVVFSPDSRILASATDQWEYQVWLWDVASGERQGVIQSPDSAVLALAWSPDGKTLATGEGYPGCKVRLWDVATLQNTETLDRHTAPVTSLAYTPDGTKLVSGSEDGTVQGWDEEATRKFTRAQGRMSLVTSLSLHPTQNILAVGSMDWPVRFWDADHQGSLSLEGHTGWINSVAFSPDGQLLASAGDNRVLLWSIPVLENLVEQSATLGPDEEWVVDEVALEGHSDSVIQVAFSPDSTRLASVSDDGTVRIWDVATQQTLTVLGGPTGWVNGLAYSPDGTTLAVGYYNHGSVTADVVQLWGTPTNKNPVNITLPDHDKVQALAYSPDGSVLAVAANVASIVLLNPQNQQLLAVLNPYTGQESTQGVPQSLAYSADGKQLAAGYGDNAIRLWDTASNTVISTLTGHTSYPDTVAFSPDGRTLASASFFGNELRVWDAVTGANLAALEASSINALTFTPDGSALLTAGYKGQRWILSAGQLTPDPNFLLDPESAINCIALSPDGKLLISGEDKGVLRVWDAQTGQNLAALQVGASRLLSVAFNPDGSTLATGSEDGLVRIWGISAALPGPSNGTAMILTPLPLPIPPGIKDLLDNKTCTSCHSFNTEEVRSGPSLAGIATRAATRVPGLNAETYLREIITDPLAYPVPGFESGGMPPYGPDGPMPMEPAELDQIVAYLLTLK